MKYWEFALIIIFILLIVPLAEIWNEYVRSRNKKLKKKEGGKE